MKEEETVKQYLDRIIVVVNNIRLLGEQFSETKIVEKVISILLERYEAKISSLNDSRDLTNISLTELTNDLYAQEQRRASRLEEHQEGVFQAKTKPASSTFATKAKKLGEISLSQMLQEVGINPAGIAKGLVIQKPIVYKIKGRPRQNQPQQPKAEARVAEEGSEHEEQVFLVSCSAAKEKATEGWLIDSGCTNHMTPNAAIFKSIDRSFKTKVKVGNGHFIKAEGKGDVLISTPTEICSEIAQLLEKGYSVVFKGKEYQISDPSGSRLISVTMADKSFVIDWINDSDSAYIASLNESKLWHQRLGHANYRLMDQLTKEDLVENFTNSVEKEEVCELCQLGQQARLPFPSNKAWRASEKL
ncbi:uncharacterized protein LOC108487810 [Gossypium arboreum]|uniref:uncharacterized protein LOC108487810 n=1 Tax=Gossypium arboreum TaxID=29729 RepID=UPI0008196BBE|nr:uncharacterized protein LOC108487810 [Gossypium arboreum]